MPGPDSGPDQGPDQSPDAAFITNVASGEVVIDLERSIAFSGVWTPLATLSDTAFEEYDLAAPPGFAPGTLANYRARRRDTTTGEVSVWVTASARLPTTRTKTVPTAYDIITTAQEELWIGIENVAGFPVKMQKRIELLSGIINGTNGRAYSNAKQNRPTMRRKAVATGSQFEGTYGVEATAEAGFPRLLATLMPVTTVATSGPPAFNTHRFANKRGSLSATIIHRTGWLLSVYPGCKATSFTTNPTKGGADVLGAEFGIRALDRLTFDLRKEDSAILAAFGLTTAGADILPPYSPDVDLEVLLGNRAAGARDLTVTVNSGIGMRNVFDRTRGASALFEQARDVQISCTTLFEDFNGILQDNGVDPAEWANTSRSAPGSCIFTVPFIAEFDPQCNGLDYSNLLSFVAPDADVSVVQATGTGNDNAEMTQTITISSLDKTGNAAGTDFYIELRNGESNAALVTPALPIPPSYLLKQNGVTPLSRSKKYETDATNTGSTTTSIVAAHDASLFKSVAGYYNNRTMRFLSGANLNQERVITAWNGSGIFTVGAAFPSAPATGDIFAIL